VLVVLSVASLHLTVVVVGYLVAHHMLLELVYVIFVPMADKVD